MDPFSAVTTPLFDKQVFRGNSVSDGASWHTWYKPRGKSCCSMLLIGGGGAGGTGVIGAASTAAGGGGGGSGAMTILEMPLDFLPDILYISVGALKNTGSATGSTYVATRPDTTANHTVAIANRGSVGGNASGATAGTAGTAGTIATNALMPLGWAWAKLALAGQVGIAGGTTGAGAALTHPLTGLRITGGTGGAGLGAGGAVGTAGGAITAIASPSYLVGAAGGLGGSAATTPPTNGASGGTYREAGFYFLGGTGGGSTHGSATGAGLVQASGGTGGIGCGSGGMGGALTGSTAGTQSPSTPGVCIIYCY
jgi:hypothetical protein